MKTLAVIALLMVVACLASPTHQTILWIFRDDCYAKFTSFDFSDSECLKFTISKGIGFAIVAGSCILKVPQILKITNSGSVEGIAAISIYVETLNFINTAANSVRLGLAFSVYGEALFIEVQNVVIILLLWKYNKHINSAEKLIVSLAIIAYTYLLFEGSYLTEEHWSLISSSSMGLTVLTRVPQIYTTFVAKSTG